MIYVVDTNVISEIFKPKPHTNAIWWMQDHNENMYLNAITIHELNFGISLLPDGKRKKSHLDRLDAITRECSDRTLPFDAFSGYLSGQLFALARKKGRVGAVEDCMIAAICARHDATLATRNVKDFEVFGIDIVNPFDYESETMQRLRRKEAARDTE
ncbi:MAG: type II toxin-antitoxin system VapC family toxin [Eggerthellaceae bacterium]|nr:type II toxin-antitoxin system VapC family toxin [Eggerthellaceae bacterium]